jgi:hypothetical protein
LVLVASDDYDSERINKEQTRRFEKMVKMMISQNTVLFQTQRRKKSL